MALRRVFAVVCYELYMYSVTLFAKSTYSVTVQRKTINVCQHRHSFVVFVLLYNMHSNKILVLSMNGNNMFTIEGESLVNQQCFICLISSLLVESTLIENADLSRIWFLAFDMIHFTTSWPYISLLTWLIDYCTLFNTNLVMAVS